MKLPALIVDSNMLANFDQAAQHEWLITNGLGGYAASTINALNTRKYHGMLVAALHPPGDRTVGLEKLDEDLLIGEETLRLGVNEFGSGLFPQGQQFLKTFALTPLPQYTYAAKGVQLKKTIGMPYGKNLTLTLYEAENTSRLDAKLRIYPMVTCRHFHTVINHAVNPLQFTTEQTGHDVEFSFAAPKATLRLRCTAGVFVEHAQWVEGLHYRQEAARGEAAVDDCYQPGYYELELGAGAQIKFGIAAAASENQTEALNAIVEAGSMFANFEQALSERLTAESTFLDRVYALHEQVHGADWLNWLLLASDSFVVRDRAGGCLVIAGYFWFESWGRDTFISLPGLLLVTNRFDDARQVLLNSASYCRRGLIPNIVLDRSGEPQYNTVDGTLWYVNSVLQYLKYTGDWTFVQTRLLSTLKSIIEYHEAGTDYGIKLDTDGLLLHGPQLTWMDACVGGHAVTPRAGKAVEIQALWYNTLKTMQTLATRFGEDSLAQKYAGMAQKAKASFERQFWDSDRQCLYDVIKDGHADLSLRPNQIIAAATDFPILDQTRTHAVVTLIQQELLTPRGLRTLSRSDPQYQSTYKGSASMRDQAYHNGTVWPWLLGPFTKAYFRAHGHNTESAAFVIKNIIQPIGEHLSEGGLGTVSEIFDGDAPHLPRGCVAQAWSVAEILRCYVEDVLQIRPKYNCEFTEP
jgi:predicted glycogen debranching enzyme